MSLNNQDYYKYRILEIIPGLLTWSTFIIAIILSFNWPIGGIYFIIAFDIYWILRIFYLMIYLLISWKKYLKAIKINWWLKLKEKRAYKDYYHLIFLPTAGEPSKVVNETLKNLANTNYNHKKMIIILAGEEKHQEEFKEIAKRIEKKYNNIFHKIIITIHPTDLEGEIPGKGSNLYHAGHKVKEYIDQNKFNYQKLIVSTFDIDTLVHPDYFAYLTYKFINHPNPYRVSFQPLAFYNNNIWESDLITRVVANSTTFWLLTDLARPDRLFTFSSHSMSWQALVDIGFWQNNIVTEDSRIFLQCFIHYNGQYKVEPMHIPVSMNTVYMGSFWQSMINQYKQMRRWAWGVEHFPYMVWRFKENNKIPWKKKLIYIWNQTEGVYSWATAPILISLMGYLPLHLATKETEISVLTQNTPIILEGLMKFGMIGLLVTAIMSVIILPPLPSKFNKRKSNKYLRYSLMFLQWIIFPITMVLFGSIPAVDAQTRLMFGKYLGFWVTKKSN